MMLITNIKLEKTSNPKVELIFSNSFGNIPIKNNKNAKNNQKDKYFSLNLYLKENAKITSISKKE